MKALLGPKDVVIAGGDKNFTLTEEERASTRATKWKKSEKMNAAWKEFLQTIRCEPLEQHEFTWHRSAKRADDKQENEEVAEEAEEEQNEQTEKKKNKMT